MRKTFRISLKLNFTSNTLGCYGFSAQSDRLVQVCLKPAVTERITSARLLAELFMYQLENAG